MTTGEIEGEIVQMLYQISQGLTLCPVIWVFLKAAKPPVALRPMDGFDCMNEAAHSNRNSHYALREAYSSLRVAGQEKTTF